MSLGSSIAGLFGRSPISPLQKHYDTVHRATEELGTFFKAAVAGDWDAARQAQQDISRLENEADAMKKEFRLNLPRSLFLPVPRADLLDMVSVQDRVANKAKDIAGLMLGRQMSPPEPLAKTMLEYLQTAINASAQAREAINELDELLETGFGGRESQLVETLIEELDRLEHVTDDQQIEIRAELFKLEEELPPVDVIFLYKIIDWIGDLADRAQKVGGYLHMLLAK
jgi:predicted phosphate transport protein (TIGR00153 family)